MRPLSPFLLRWTVDHRVYLTQHPPVTGVLHWQSRLWVFRSAQAMEAQSAGREFLTVVAQAREAAHCCRRRCRRFHGL